MEQDKIKKNKKRHAFDSSYLCSKTHFEDDGTQNYLVFQPIYNFLKTVADTNNISK